MTCARCAALDEGAENCPACKGSGEIVVADRCPLEVVTSEAWQMLDLASWMKEGLPPVAGGVLNQTLSFMQAYAFVGMVRAQIEAEDRKKK